ncbi:MAG: hypothetical protein GX660_03305 [Clostridiaceae bacterium]|nr:hypothetical protein [Clostridiaceae bacterium]
MKKLIFRLTLFVLVAFMVLSNFAVYAAVEKKGPGEGPIGGPVGGPGGPGGPGGGPGNEKAPKGKNPVITDVSLTQVSPDPLEIKVDVKVKHEPKPGPKHEPKQEQNLLYQIWGEDAGGWKLIKSYDTDSTVNWKPTLTKDNRYSVQARIKDADTGVVYDQKVGQITCHSSDVLRIDRITTDSTTEGFGEVRKPVKITVLASGSKTIYYKFEVSENTKNKKKVSENTFNKSNKFTWVPQNAGSYEIKVFVRNKDNTQTDEMTMVYNITSKQYIYPEFESMDITKDENGKVNVSLTDKSRPGFSELYKLTVGEHMRQPVVSDGYSDSKSYSWKPDKSGVYEFRSFVKDSGSVNSDDEIRKEYRITKPEVGTVKLDSVKLSKEELVQPVGTTMEFTASASGGNQLQYSFWRLEAKGYRLIQDYSVENTFQWTPLDPGVYTILTRVKDTKSGSYEDQKSVVYRITDGTTSDVKINKVDISGNKKKGTLHTISVNASGSNNLMYKFQISDELNSWRTLKEFSPDNTCSWLPKHSRNYKIIVWVKDAKSGSYEQQSVIEVKIND